MIWKGLTAGLAVLVALLAIPAVRHLREVPPPAPPPLHARLAVPGDLLLGAGRDGLDAAIAPDETSVVFPATREGRVQLYRYTFDSGQTAPLPGTEGGAMPAWRHDGGALAFFAGGQLKTLALDTGTVTSITDAPAPAGVTWLPDASLAAVLDANQPVVGITGGRLAPLTSLAGDDTGHAFPKVDASGRLLFIAMRRGGNRTIRLIVDGQPHELSDTAGHAELHGDMLVHVRDGVLLAQRIDPTRWRMAGRSTALATGVGVSPGGRASFATSGRLAVWAAATPISTELAWFDSNGQRTGTAAEPGDYWQARLSPDGRSVAVTTLDPLLRTLDVMLVPLAAPGNARRLSQALGADSDPVWSPDGQTVIYRSAQGGPASLFSRRIDRPADNEQTFFRADQPVTASDWRGGVLLVAIPDANGQRHVVVLDRTRNTQTSLTAGGFASWDARWSPDQRWVASVSDESGQPEVYVQAWPSGSPRVRATFGGGQRPQWGPDQRLYFARADTVRVASVTRGSDTATVSTPQTVLEAPGLRDFALTPDGRRLLVVAEIRTATTATAQLITNWATTVPVPPEARWYER